MALGDDEAVSEEMVVTDLEVGNVSVDMVPEKVPSTETGVAPELSAPTPSAVMPPIADQVVLRLPAGVAGVAKEVSPVLATGTLLSNVIASGKHCPFRMYLFEWYCGLDFGFIGLGEKTAPVAVPAAPSTRPRVAEKKHVRLPPRSTR